MLLPIVLVAASVVSAFPQGGPPRGPHGFGGFPSGGFPSGGFPTSPSHHGPSFANSSSNATLPWAPAGPNDSRSPCPALNTLANHFLLPHDGKNISMSDIISAFAIGQNFAADTVTGAFKGAIGLCSKQTGTNCTTFDLAMLDQPHAIEHDNSLSREDYNFGKGNNHDFSPAIWGQVLGVWHGAPIINFQLANAARLERVFVANKTDVPGWYVNATQQGLGETAFYLSLFGDPVEGNARQDWINVWFEQERMPFELGWNATQRETITAASLKAMQAKLLAAPSF